MFTDFIQKAKVYFGFLPKEVLSKELAAFRKLGYLELSELFATRHKSDDYIHVIVSADTTRLDCGKATETYISNCGVLSLASCVDGSRTLEIHAPLRKGDKSEILSLQLKINKWGIAPPDSDIVTNKIKKYRTTHQFLVPTPGNKSNIVLCNRRTIFDNNVSKTSYHAFIAVDSFVGCDLMLLVDE